MFGNTKNIAKRSEVSISKDIWKEMFLEATWLRMMVRVDLIPWGLTEQADMIKIGDRPNVSV